MATGSRIERKKYQKKSSRKSSNKGRHILRNILIGIFAIFFIILLGGGALFGYYVMQAPDINQEDLVGQVSSKIYDREGNLIKELGGQNRDLMTADDIPENLKNAVLAIEDARFYSHSGVDPIRIVGAVFANIRAGGIAQGGSTITQQLVKLSVFSTDFHDQTLERKAQEAWLALDVERKYSKDEILSLYLNKLFYSNNVYGAKTAAKQFFGKDLDQLSIAEAALLAGIPQAPSDYDPYSHPKEATERRDLVLDVMLDRKLINQAQHDEAINTSVFDSLVALDHSSSQEKDLIIDAYLAMVADEVKEKMNLDIYTDGLQVYTNMDYGAQEHLYQTVNNNEEIGFPNDSMQTAASIINTSNGELVAVIGGRKQENTMALNRATDLKRSIGSTMKPLADYGPAFEYLNFSTGTLVVDEPYKYSSGAEIYNYDMDYKGKQTLREALAGSRNIPALKTLQAVGLDNSYAFLQKLDINIVNDDKKELVEANAIGGEVSPVKLSAAYAAISNYGKYHKPITVNRVVTAAGTEERFESKEIQAMKDTTAYMLVDILKGVPGNFASRSAIEGLHQAGKTGTTNYTNDQLNQLGIDSSTYAAPDGWYAGITPQYAFAGWVGYDNPLEAGNYLSLSDTSIPQAIYKEMITYLMNDVPNTDWLKPDNIVETEIEKYTDPILLPGPFTPAEARSKELFIKGQEPKKQSLAYGRYIDAPTNFNAQYNQDDKTITATWDPLTTSSGQFVLNVNGVDVYSGSDTSVTIPAESDGEYTLRLTIVDGNSSSDTLVITLNISGSEDSSQESESIPDESSSESTSIPPLDSSYPQDPPIPDEFFENDEN
ncbi:transglycosylase domain-containing protein [Eremococcus coleocola]|uniref:Penicillin-binding protein, 1A family n=1 Tax=Eremococcus coleocola ACS-139-V-Col8 TaxID=908337 RepID=E4KLU4_9LACT|nr:PBP1A family penicillin-binding protein [Eremococcus coleocola]EFR31981.1 penicillin-binding protein, 1A family [Eremococcus coleocola ACS-139-V-Col8]